MTLRPLLFALALGASLPAAFAAPVACPDLKTAVLASACPTEEELLFTFNGYCSDNARIYGKGAEVCTDYQAYRRMKNIVLWESADGGFQSYVSCELPEAQLRAKKPQAINTAKDKGEKGMGRLMCDYGDDVVFTRRTRETCRVDTAAACKTDIAACRADCKAE